MHESDKKNVSKTTKQINTQKRECKIFLWPERCKLISRNLKFINFHKFHSNNESFRNVFDFNWKRFFEDVN